MNSFFEGLKFSNIVKTEVYLKKLLFEAPNLIKKIEILLDPTILYLQKNKINQNFGNDLTDSKKAINLSHLIGLVRGLVPMQNMPLIFFDKFSAYLLDNFKLANI